MGCGVQLKSETTEDKPLSYPFQYSEKTDSYIQLPSDWSNYLSNPDVQFTGMQIQSRHVNKMFPGNLTK